VTGGQQAGLPVHYREGCGVPDEKRPFDDCQSHSLNALPICMMFRRRVDRLPGDGCSGGRGVGGCYGHAAPVNGWSVAGAAGMPANLGSDSVAAHHYMM
jgi:hypothetical protein